MRSPVFVFTFVTIIFGFSLGWIVYDKTKELIKMHQEFIQLKERVEQLEKVVWPADDSI